MAFTAEQQRDLRRTRKKAGLCVRCGNPAAVLTSKGLRTGVHCLEHARYQRKRDQKDRYGLSTTEVDNLDAKRVEGCMICGEKENKQLGKILAIDHDHKTGEVRGLLCMHCNVSLGWFEKREKAILDYLGGTN